jgi:hypothetical protein
MGTRRRHRSSRLAREYRPEEGGDGREARPRRRRRGSRSLRRKLTALAFGGLLFGVAGGLLGLLAMEFDHGGDEEADPAAYQASPGPPAALRPAGLVAVVTCPGPAKSRRHPAYAAACGDLAALQGLLGRAGAADEPDPRPEFAGRTPLHHAAQRGDTAMLTALLAAGADPDRADAEGHTPLHLVAATPTLRHPEFPARRLLDGGARLDLKNGRGLTPLQELEADHHRLLAQQNLAKVLFREERQNQIAEWLTPTVPWNPRPLVLPEPEPPQETTVEVDTALGKLRIPVDPPAAGAER